MNFDHFYATSLQGSEEERKCFHDHTVRESLFTTMAVRVRTPTGFRRRLKIISARHALGLHLAPERLASMKSHHHQTQLGCRWCTQKSRGSCGLQPRRVVDGVP